MGSPKVLALVISVDVLAAAGMVLLFPYHSDDGLWLGLGLLASLAALGGANPVKIPQLKTSISVTDAFVFTALGAFGPMAA